MKQYVFSHDVEQAAKDFASAPKGISFTMIPHDIGANTKFWVKLVELDPNYIEKVPKEVLDSESFADSVDHRVFYSYLPKKYLTVEDYNAVKAMPEMAISTIRNPAKLNQHNEYLWYCTDDYHWKMASQMNKYTLLNLIEEGRGAERINSELWSQEFADYLWKSAKAMVSFDAIPKQFVREEWMVLMSFYREKRYPVFGNGSTFSKAEKIPEYWGSFKTEEEISLALDCEDLYFRCDNPYGYTCEFRLDSSMRRNDYAEIFSNLWEAVSGVVANNKKLLKRMYELYGSRFAKAMPRELFDMEWLINSEEFEWLVDSYKCRFKNYMEAEYEVEKLEAKERMDEWLEMLKEHILSNVSMSDEELEKFISSFL